MIFIKFILIFLLTLMLQSKTIHEDAEDTQLTRWKLINATPINSIHNKLDNQKKSRIIEFLANGHNFGYELKMKKQKKEEYWLSWQMKFSKDFVVIIALDTNRGQYYLVYTSGEDKSYMQYGLGATSKNGRWQTIERNLQEDIAYFDNRVKILAIKSFVLKGSGELDNIITTKNRFNRPQIKPPREVVLESVINVPTKVVPPEKKKERKIFTLAKKTSPIVHLKGVKTIKLKRGEAYVEPGVSANDEQDGELNVVCIENIDVNQDGRYMILYMATDSDGNIALDKRYVDVGTVVMDKEEVVNEQKKQEDEKEEEKEEESLDDETKERNMQIEVWERKLELKELELKRNKNLL